MWRPLEPGWYRLLSQLRLCGHSHPLLVQGLEDLFDSQIYWIVHLMPLTTLNFWDLVAFLLKKAQPDSLINQKCYLLWIHSAYLEAECLRTFANYWASWVWIRSILVEVICPWLSICYCYSSLLTCHCFWIQRYLDHILWEFWTSYSAPKSHKHHRYFVHSQHIIWDLADHTLIYFLLMIHDPSIIFIVACYRHFANVSWNHFDSCQTSYHFETIQTDRYRWLCYCWLNFLSLCSCLC